MSQVIHLRWIEYRACASTGQQLGPAASVPDTGVLPGFTWSCLVLLGLAWFCLVLPGLTCPHDEPYHTSCIRLWATLEPLCSHFVADWIAVNTIRQISAANFPIKGHLRAHNPYDYLISSNLCTALRQMQSGESGRRVPRAVWKGPFEMCTVCTG